MILLLPLTPILLHVSPPSPVFFAPVLLIASMIHLSNWMHALLTSFSATKLMILYWVGFLVMIQIHWEICEFKNNSDPRFSFFDFVNFETKSALSVSEKSTKVIVVVARVANQSRKKATTKDDEQERHSIFP